MTKAVIKELGGGGEICTGERDQAECTAGGVGP
jgi:hypothetical protein